MNKYRVVDTETGDIVPIDSTSLHDLHLKLANIDPKEEDHMKKLIEVYMNHTTSVLDVFMESHGYDFSLLECKLRVGNKVITLSDQQQMQNVPAEVSTKMTQVNNTYYGNNRSNLTKLEDKKKNVSTNKKNVNNNKVLLLESIMPFGKHKGTLVKNLPKSYLNWLESEGYTFE